MAQSTISFAGALNDQLDYLIGMSIFTNARPFSLLDDIYLRRLLRKLNPDYTPPDQHRISGDILDKCYERQRILVLQELRKTRYLNITIDEITNITNNRMVTLSFSLRDKSLFYCLEDVGDRVFNAQAIADWIYSKMESYLATEGSVGNWNRLNSLSTDTTATMRSAWQILSEKPELRHLFCIPCDSHGIQLVVKDLLHLPRIQEAFSVANSIITYFRSSAKQLASLRTFQQQIYSEARSLLAAVITHWGSQYDMLYSLKRSSEALKAWAFAALSSGDAKVSIIQIILYRKDLWLEIDNLLALLEPLHKAQKASEAQNADIMMVTKRWLDLQAHFEAQIMVSLFSEDIRSYLLDENSSWVNRFNHQLSPLHWAAYYLHPQNAADDVPLPSNIINTLNKVIEKYAGEAGINNFFYFRNKQEGFYNPDIWKQKNPLDFWLRAKDMAPDLAQFAIRLFFTTANSVAAERTFSAMNLQHTKLRNRLNPEQTERLVFLHMNTRALEAAEGKDIDLVEPDILDQEDMARTQIFRDTTLLGDQVETPRSDDHEADAARSLLPALPQVLGKRPWED